MAPFTLRPATVDDALHILNLNKAHALFANDPDAVKATESLIRENCFGKRSNVVLAEVEGEKEPVAMAIYFFNFSAWTARPGLYLDDLFVKEAFRKFGIGKAMFKYLAKVAKENDCARMEWTVLDSNEQAKSFYAKGLGAKHHVSWEIMRLEGEAFDQLKGVDSEA